MGESSWSRVPNHPGIHRRGTRGRHKYELSTATRRGSSSTKNFARLEDAEARMMRGWSSTSWSPLPMFRHPGCGQLGLGRRPGSCGRLGETRNLVHVAHPFLHSSSSRRSLRTCVHSRNGSTGDLRTGANSRWHS